MVFTDQKKCAIIVIVRKKWAEIIIISVQVKTNKDKREATV